MTNADDSLAWRSATEIARDVRAGDLSIVEIGEYFVDRIERLNPDLNAYVVFDPDQLLADARRLQDGLTDGTPGALYGVPYSLKEATAYAGLPCTGGMKPAAGAVADHDATLVRRLKGAGGLLLGKTNMPEAGYWGGTDGHLYGPTHNPWKQGYSAGGSSGGAAAAIAAGLGPLAEGSDGAGSVRIPAAACGVYGFKPSLGIIPQEFLPSRHESWIFHGPLTRTVADAALMLDAMAGPSGLDPLSIPASGVSFSGSLDTDLTGWTIAWSPDLGLGSDYVDAEVHAICEQAVLAFAELGATVIEAAPAWKDLERTMWNSIWLPAYGMSADILDWNALHGEVDEQLIELITQSGMLSGRERARADVDRGAIARAHAEFMQDVDILVSPTLATTAYPLGQFAPDHLRDKPLQQQLLGWLLTYPFNMTSTPSGSVPAGFAKSGLPVGLQLSGGHRADLAVLQASAAFERARPWKESIPSMAS